MVEIMQKKRKPSVVKVKEETKPILSHVANKLRGKELFPKKNERAKKFLTKLKSFPS